MNEWFDKSERPQRVHPTQPVGDEEANDYHCLQKPGLVHAVTGRTGGWGDETDHDADRGCRA